eukprot:m.1424994 g.1424994  ORF g.1424994 m.1424994 type:complete len:416 (-) comp25062_c0_seq23:77-1324(-)
MSACVRYLLRAIASKHAAAHECNGQTLPMIFRRLERSFQARTFNSSSTSQCKANQLEANKTAIASHSTYSSDSIHGNVADASEDDVYRPWGDKSSLGRAPPAPRLGTLRGIEPSERNEHQGNLLSLVNTRMFRTTPEWKRGQAMVGASLAVCGMSALAYHHADVLLTVENMGYSALFLGATTLYAARPNSAPESDENVMGFERRGDRGGHGDGEPRFRFVPLNIQRHRDIRSLNKLLQKDDSDHGTYVKLPNGVSSMLHEANAKQIARHKASIQQLETAMHEDVRSALDAGVDPVRIQQHLLPRVYVLTFEDNINRNVKEKRKPTISRVEAFSAAVTLMLSAASPFDEVVIKITSPGGGACVISACKLRSVCLDRHTFEKTSAVPLPSDRTTVSVSCQCRWIPCRVFLHDCCDLQ